MDDKYKDVLTRFLRQDERLVLSEENEMPLVIEAKDNTDSQFLQDFLSSNSTKIREDISHFGAVLLRGFDIASDETFEKTILSIQGFEGISDAFMSEYGREHVGHLKYVLHTNSAYKTGGTLYLGGFHSENYYSTDVPAYISFCCLKPSKLGGETGLINMEKIYQLFDEELKQKLETNNSFVGKWLISEVENRYQIPREHIEKICHHFDIPLLNAGEDKFILMYKPNVFVNPQSKSKSLGINLFELPSLNAELRKCFIDDYQGKTWFWHRFVWKLPESVLKIFEYIYLIFAAFFSSPKHSLMLLRSKYRTYRASQHLSSFNDKKVGACFNDKDIKLLAGLMRKYYCSCLWKSGDILLVDNRKVMHAGMPGAGPRQIRAMICNPLDMTYSFTEPGYLVCQNRTSESVGFYMTSGVEPNK